MLSSLWKTLRFLLFMPLLVGGLASGADVNTKPPLVSDSPYQLHFFHTHTGERLNIVYRNSEGYDYESLARLDRYLRDNRTADIHAYDPRVFDLLHDLITSLGKD